MVSTSVILGISSLGLVLLGLIGFLIYLMTKEDEDLENSNIVINLMPQFAVPEKGYAIGLELSQRKVADRYIIDYKPMSVNMKELKDKKVPESVRIISDKVVTIPQNTLDNHRTIKVILAPDSEDYIPQLRTLLGEVTENWSASNVVIKALRNRVDVENKLLMKTDGGSRMEEYIETDEELNKDLHKKILEKTPEKKPTTYGYTPSSSSVP